MNARWLVFFIAACGTSPRPAAPPPKSAAAAPEQSVTRESAERALRSDAPLDYERPFNGKPEDRSAATRLFHARCEGGDARACIVESELIGDNSRLDAVAANCRKGDLMSCRALPLDDSRPRFADMPGAVSRSNACSAPIKPHCDIEKLRQECSDGFAWACSTLAQNDTSGAGDALVARFLKLSVEGCRAGIALECGFAGLAKNDLDRIDAAKRLCDLHRARCTDLSSAYSAQHDMTNARDALERACQYGSTSACLELGVKYVDRDLPEPVPDRGQALIDWACSKKLPKYLAQKCPAAKK